MPQNYIFRKLSDLNLDALPINFLLSLGITGAGDLLRVSLQGSSLVIEKHDAICIFCGDTEGIRSFQGCPVCGSCGLALAGVFNCYDFTRPLPLCGDGIDR